MNASQQEVLPHDLQVPENVSRAITWLASSLTELEYGEVGITFVLHQGTIVRIKQLVEQSYRSMEAIIKEDG